MVELATGVLQTSMNVLGLKIGQFFQHLLGRQAIGEQIQDIHHADTHPANTWSPATLLGV